MRELLGNFFLKNTVKKYHTEALLIERASHSLGGLTNGTLARNFQNLRGRTDREAVGLGFAIIIEMAERTLNLRPYLVQIMGALAMNDGNIAEMATGEGKTLTAAMPLAWQGLQARANIMTVNDYLAKRDALFLEPLYEALGLSCGYLQDNMGREERQMQYQSSIVYGTSSQFVFDYLRDNIVFDVSEILQQDKDFILVDEADSILIDEARTPLILSGQGEHSNISWEGLRDFVATLSFEHVVDDSRTQLEKINFSAQEITSDIGIDRKNHEAFLTDKGIAKVEQLLLDSGVISNTKELWQPSRSYIWRAVGATVKAKHVYFKDRDYIVKDGKVVIVDQETGRLSHGKRWNEGLHQAIECKESVEICPETVEVGRIALANYMSLYKKVSGMTGTAMTVADEIANLYQLNVVPIPTHKPKIRQDLSDLIFMSRAAKWKQIVNDVIQIHETGQPILIGTASVEDSEFLSDLLNKEGLSHRMLNAKHDEEEASVIAQAGRLGSITIATSMAGRGTDILLGGNQDFVSDEAQILEIEENRKKVVEAGGLFVIGAERLDSKRLDLQLAGRAGRQGDPGKTRFYVALDDQLMKNFGGETIRGLFKSIGVPDEDGVEHPMVDKAISNAQKKRQSTYMDARKNGLKQDSVIDSPRRVIYELRSQILRSEPDENIDSMRSLVDGAADRLFRVYFNDFSGFEETWNIVLFKDKIRQWGLSDKWFETIYQSVSEPSFNAELFSKEMKNWIHFDLNARIKQLVNQDQFAIRTAKLMAIDSLWRGFLDDAEHVRTAIHLRAYANEKPDLALQKEIFALFAELYADIPVAMMDFIYGAIVMAENNLDTVAA